MITVKPSSATVMNKNTSSRKVYTTVKFEMNILTVILQVDSFFWLNFKPGLNCNTLRCYNKM